MSPDKKIFHCRPCNKEQDPYTTHKMFNGELICDRCYDYFIEFHDDGYNDLPAFWLPCKLKNEDTKLFFGVEFELESMVDDDHSIGVATRYIIENNNRFLSVHDDCSLDCGMEIITHPFTWNWMKTNLDIFNPIWALKERYNISGNMSTCGLHIHTSKEAYQPDHYAKLLTFFYGRTTYWKKFSERLNHKVFDSSEYYHGYSYIGKYKKSYLKTRAKYLFLDEYMAKTRGIQKNKYEAINDSSKDTIEYRLFQGTNNKNRFLECIQSIYGMFNFTKDMSIKKLSWNNFKKYLAKSPNDYKELLDKLVKV
jgi:hypothetical protein